MGWWRSRNFWRHVELIQTFLRVWRLWTRPSDTRHDHDTCHGPENILSIWKYNIWNRSTFYLTSWTRGERISSRTCVTGAKISSDRDRIPPPLLVYSCPNFRDRGEQDLEGRKTRRRFSFPPQFVRKHGLLKKKKKKEKSRLKEAEDETTRRFPRMKESLFIRR